MSLFFFSSLLSVCEEIQYNFRWRILDVVGTLCSFFKMITKRPTRIASLYLLHKCSKMIKSGCCAPQRCSNNSMKSFLVSTLHFYSHTQRILFWTFREGALLEKGRSREGDVSEKRVY